MVKAVLFDLRGTLADVAKAQLATRDFLYSQFGRSLSREAFDNAFHASKAEIVEKLGRNSTIINWDLLIITNLMNRIGQKIDGSRLEKLMQEYNSIFVSNVSLFLDVEPCLRFLKDKNLKLGVVIEGTSARETAVLAKLGLDKFFNVVVISEEVGHNKLSPLPLQRAIEKTALPPNEIIVVGDRIDKDISHANKLGCVSVLLQRGQSQNLQNVQREAMPVHVIKKLTELANFVD